MIFTPLESLINFLSNGVINTFFDMWLNLSEQVIYLEMIGMVLKQYHSTKHHNTS